MPNSKIAYIDIAKGIAIVSVVLWHISFSFDLGPLIPLKTLLGGMWHVPVFFLISGFFLKDEKLLHPKSFIRSTLKNVYFLTLCFYIPAVLCHNLFIGYGLYNNVEPYNLQTHFVRIAQTFLFAGREPIVSPLWFAYVLCLARIGFSLLSTSCKKVWKNKYEFARIISILIFASVSAILSNKLGLTINRLSNTLVVLLLLAIGQYVFQKRKIEFNSTTVFFCSFLLAWQVAILNGNVLLNDNVYKSLFHLVGGSLCMLYVVCFVSRKIEKKFIGKILKTVGEKSFYIMALHFMAFKLAGLLLQSLGYQVDVSLLVPKTNNSVFLIALYLVCGVFVPVLFAKGIDFLKTFFLKAK